MSSVPVALYHRVGPRQVLQVATEARDVCYLKIWLTVNDWFEITIVPDMDQIIIEGTKDLCVKPTRHEGIVVKLEDVRR